MRVVVTSLLIAVACSTTACGGSPAEDLCDAACECGACTDASRDQCVDQIERARDAADERDCGGEMDDYIQCVADAEDLCDDPELTGICTDERDEVNACAGGVGAAAE